MDPSLETCPTLAERVRLGERAAEEELVETYSHRIFVMAMTQTRDREASRDLVQEVLWAVIRALRNGQVREPDKLSGFICGTTRNLISNFRRSRPEPGRHVPISDELRLADPDHAGDEADRIRLVKEAMVGLSEDDRQIVSLTLVEGLKSGQIAARLGLPADVVRQRKVRAVRRVIDILGDRARR